MHKVAGAIAARMRFSDSGELAAMGARATNQAVKAMTIAKEYVASDTEGTTLVGTVVHGDAVEMDEDRSVSVLTINILPYPADDVPTAAETLRVSSASIAERVAGAISARVEETGAVDVTAMGNRAIATSLDAIALAQAALANGGAEALCAHAPRAVPRAPKR